MLQVRRNKEAIFRDVAGLRDIVSLSATRELKVEELISMEALLQDIEANVAMLPDSISLFGIFKDMFKR